VAWQIPAVLAAITSNRDSADIWLAAQHLALEAVREQGDLYGEAITLDNLGIAHRRLFHLAQSEEYFRAAMTAFQRCADGLGQARAANGLGVVHLFAHRIDQALASFEQALALARELDDHAFIGFFTRNLGWALVEGGEPERAQPLLRQSAGMLAEAGERIDEAEALTLLATSLRRSGQLAQARETANQALVIAGELDATLFEALALRELGRIESARREAAEALAYLQQAAALFWRVGRPDLQATAWNATGEAYLILQRAEDATDFLRRAAAAHRDRGDQWQLALTLADLADARTLGGSPHEAEQYRRDAIRLLAEFSDPMAQAKRAALESPQPDT
jgi:tetratricopeptide (TPR) repeat protein